MSEPLVLVEDLSLRFGETLVLKDISLRLDPGERVGLVGPSGSGKSLLARALLGLLPEGATADGRVLVRDGEGQFDLLRAPKARARRYRATAVGYVGQDPRGSFTPVRTIGSQLREVARASASKGFDLTAVLRSVRLDEGARVAGSYPHELSGGMLQRAAIAAAILRNPALLIADEPTTALDATVQLQVLELLSDLHRRTPHALVLISHDPAVVAFLAERSIRLDGGCVALGPSPEAESAVDLRGKINRRTFSRSMPVLRIEHLSKSFADKRLVPWLRRPVQALSDVSLTLHAGEVVGIVGESGCGKTTLARCVLRLEAPSSGAISFSPGDPEVSGGSPSSHRAPVQLIFQHARQSFDPRRRVRDQLTDGRPELSASDRRACEEAVLEDVELDEETAGRFPHQLSGGECQRAGIARALLVEPRVLVLDEPVAALDRAVRDRILALLHRLTRERDLACLIISHDLSVVEQVADVVCVLYLGRVVEIGPVASVLVAPAHPYTRALLASRLPAKKGSESRPLPLGEVPTQAAVPSGCPFHPRCSLAVPECSATIPALVERTPGHQVACPVTL